MIKSVSHKANSLSRDFFYFLVNVKHRIVKIIANIKKVSYTLSSMEIQKENLTTWLVFLAGNQNYAIDSSLVKEILRNNAVYPLPFAPSYIDGVLNSYGLPYAVLDIAEFMEEESSEGKMFLILNNDEHLALKINDIQEFHTDAEVTQQSLVSGAESPFFNGAIQYKNITAPILNLNGILERIHLDLDK